MENSRQKFRFESETEAENEKREMSSKRVKICGILILCFLLLNFILVVVVMNLTPESSSSFSTEDFSAAVNKMRETGEIVDQLKFELGGIEKWMNSTEEKLESHQIGIEALSNQTKIDKQVEALENESRQLKKSHEELKEQFESQSQKIDQLENNISSGQNVSFLAPTESTEPPAENGDQTPIDPQLLQSCSDAMKRLSSPRSQKQRIYPHGNGTTLEVLCDFETDGGGWTIIQKRTSGPKQEFNKNWDEYKNGFGSLEGNFWLGLDNIRALTQNGDQELRIELEDFQGEKRWAKYSNFSISDAPDFYRLEISGFFANSTAGDSMTFASSAANGARFSTKDEDHDTWSLNCAAYFSTGGWWHNKCFYAALNGLYFEEGETVSGSGIDWITWKGGLAKTEMKIRTKK